DQLSLVVKSKERLHGNALRQALHFAMKINLRQVPPTIQRLLRQRNHVLTVACDLLLMKGWLHQAALLPMLLPVHLWQIKRHQLAKRGIFTKRRQRCIANSEKMRVSEELKVERRPKGADVGSIALCQRNKVAIRVMQPA